MAENCRENGVIMMTSVKSGKQEKGGSSNRHFWLDIGLVVFLVVIFLIPFALIIAVSGPEPYHIVAGNPVKNAAQAVGITINSENDTQWNVPGAMGGKRFVLSDSQGNIVTIETQAFDSAESRDAMINTYNSNKIGKGKPVGDLIIVGQHLIYITPANNPLIKEISQELKKYRSI